MERAGEYAQRADGPSSLPLGRLPSRSVPQKDNVLPAMRWARSSPQSVREAIASPQGPTKSIETIACLEARDARTTPSLPLSNWETFTSPVRDSSFNPCWTVRP